MQKNEHNCLFKRYRKDNDLNEVRPNTTKNSSISYSSVVNKNSTPKNIHSTSNNLTDSRKDSFMVDITKLSEKSSSDNISKSNMEVLKKVDKKKIEAPKNRTPPTPPMKDNRELGAKKNKINFSTSPRSHLCEKLPVMLSPIKTPELDDTEFPPLLSKIDNIGEGIFKIHLKFM